MPKLMLDRFGGMGFVVFAVPNVVGVVAFGYLLAARRGRPGAGRELVRRHGTAMVVFSLVAVAFHAYFVAFLFAEHVLAPGDAPWLPLAAAAAVFVAGRLLAELDDRGWLFLAAATYACSLLAFASIAPAAAPPWRGTGTDGPGALAWIAPVVIVGFLLCPVLDLTFHRALDRAPSRHAFAIFGAGFAVMIVLTAFLWYPTRAMLGLGLGHLVAQSTFTVGAHLREIQASPAIPSAIRKRGIVLLPLLAASRLLVARLLSDSPGLGDALYVRFLVFYGLAFPAYVLLFVGPWSPLTMSRRSLAALAAVIVLAAPLYEAAFLHGRPWLLAGPAAAVALWALVRRPGRLRGAGYAQGRRGSV